MLIKHPLEECVSSGNLNDLDLKGRTSLDLIMDMISDLRFRRDGIKGICARYFLFINTSVIQGLCVSARIDCDKLREHVRKFDQGEESETKTTLDTAQTAFPFLGMVEPLAGDQNPLPEITSKPCVFVENVELSVISDAALIMEGQCNSQNKSLLHAARRSQSISRAVSLSDSKKRSVRGRSKRT